ncbi:MAG: DUF1318 domain-containing protein [Verrucomicrobiae bacterium]|nr:DUF1318 domain-containing protein [Verrucomicrobiae bacterium]
MTICRSLVFGGLLLALVGCAPTVQIATPEPLKVDIAMTIDVNQKTSAGSEKRPLGDAEVEALRRREARSGEIWTMKNDGVAVETVKGYLEAHPKSGWDSAAVKKLVAEENADRKLMYEAEAISESRPMTAIEEEAGRLLRQQAYGRTTPGRANP